MASINKLLNTIKSAVYGVDIRKSIHDAILQCYIDATQSIDVNKEIEEAKAPYATLKEKIESITGISDDIKLSAKIYTPTTENQIIAKGQYLAGDQTILGDVNLKAENIIKGKSIFGVNGSAEPGSSFEVDEKIVWSGCYANQAVQAARSYWDARVDGQIKFAYSAGKSIFEGKLTNSAGNILFDCSTFLVLVAFLGIDFANSPFVNASGSNKTIDASTIVPLSKFAWAHDRGKVRYAADIAEYFYSRLVPIDEVMPGDITCHAGKNTDGTYKIKNRFKNISHVGIIAEEKYIQRDANGKVTYFEYYNVTSTENVCIRTKSTSRDDIVFVVRPDYRPRIDVSEINETINLMPLTYKSCKVGKTLTLNSMKFKVNTDGSIETTGQPTSSTTFYLSHKSYPQYLKKGTYKLTGCPKRSDVTTGKTWGLSIKKKDGTDLAWDLGDGATFTVTEDFAEIYIYIYISKVKNSTGYKFTPKLIRTA
ncbi:hypothetical protein [Intestinibacter bartlettii]|uniref:hypothetical protein n=1 Tax=Intestinibacter bartlettii TaxID=261299 RepID=UPI0039F4EB53